MALFQKDIFEAHACFTQHMELSDTGWSGAFEFVQYGGFDLFNACKFPDSVDAPFRLSPRTERAIILLNGPHAETLIKAYKHRRYSLKGRFRKLWLTPLHAVGLVVCATAKVLRDYRGSW